jgi:hypothetical protein
LVDVLYQVEEVLPPFFFFQEFYNEWLLNFIKSFSMSINRWSCDFSSVTMIVIVNWSRIPGISPTGYCI